MKNQDFITSDYPRACGVCEIGSPSFDGSAVLCPRRGIMAPDDCCRRFVYDPLKRSPQPAPTVADDFSPDDFTL